MTQRSVHHSSPARQPRARAPLPRVAFFTSTMGGGGHLALALSVRRGLERAGFPGHLRCFGPPIPYRGVDVGDYVVAALSEAELRSPTLARNSDLARQLCAWRPDLVLVDKFWFPVRHILPLLRAPAWLLLHWCPPGWMQGPPALREGDAWSRFERVISIEPLGHCPGAEEVPPLVVCNPDECHPPDALKRRLGIDPRAHLTLIVQTGMEGEVERLEAAHRGDPRRVVRALSMHRGDPIFPIAPWLPGADALIGGCGYGFPWEVVWLGLRERTTLHPFPRTIDDQALRARLLPHITPRENGADVLARQIQARVA